MGIYKLKDEIFQTLKNPPHIFRFFGQLKVIDIIHNENFYL